jgi:hypothetical protein
MFKLTTLAIAVVLVVSGSAAFAQMQRQPAKPTQPRSAQSMACSKQADALHLHGKARKHFRAKCRRDSRKQAA